MCFYAENGLLNNQSIYTLQRDLDIVIGLFERAGLKTNEAKPKSMIVQGAQASTAQSQKLTMK